MSFTTTLKQQMSVDRFWDLCSVVLETIFRNQIWMICGLYIQVPSSNNNQIMSVFNMKYVNILILQIEVLLASPAINKLGSGAHQQTEPPGHTYWTWKRTIFFSCFSSLFFKTPYLFF